MARASTKRGTRTRPHARRDVNGYRAAEELMFFPRLRRKAKWIFLGLALVFAVGFLGFGVGAGGSGIGDYLSDLLHGGSAGGSAPSVEEAREAVADHPQDAKARLQLADALERAGRRQEAIAALQAYVKMRPKDADALRRLAGLWVAEANQRRTVAANAYARAQSADPAETFDSGPLAQALGSSPLTAGASERASQKANEAIVALQDAYREQEKIYKKLTRLTPDDPSLFLQLGQAAQLSQDTQTAILAYRKFLALAPDDPNAREVRRLVKQLTAQ